MNIEIIPNVIVKNKKYIVETLNPVDYSLQDYKTYSQGTGKNVIVAVLDSGCPCHKDVKLNKNNISLCEDNVGIKDKIGHATIIAGIINANNKKNIMGISPNAKLIYGKVVDDKGKCNFNSLIAGVLWAIVKKANVIVIAMSTSYNYMILRDVIKKAKKHDICVFAAIEKQNDNDNDDNYHVGFPAQYDEAISVGMLTSSKIKNEIIKKKADIYLPNKSIYTTYLNNKYIKTNGSSVSTAIFAGIAANFIEQYKKEKKNNISNLVLKQLKSIIKR
jgi:major intracellular serine protease